MPDYSIRDVLSSNLFISDIKHDLSILYAFCRVTDDMIDNETEASERKKQLSIIIEFLDQLFNNRKMINYFVWHNKSNARHSSKDRVNWSYFSEHLTPVQLAAFRAISRIAHYLPQAPFYELMEGYKWDIDGRLVKDEEELKLYSSYVASSVATLCTFIICTRSNYWPDNFGKKCVNMIEHARGMGMVGHIKQFKKFFTNKIINFNILQLFSFSGTSNGKHQS